MEFAVFILLLLIVLALASPFICALSFIVDVLAAVLGLVVRVVRGLAGFVRGMVARGRDQCNREGR